MIDYDAYCKIHHLKQQQLKPSQIASEMGLDLRTVEKWIDEPHFRPRQSGLRASKLDPFKPLIQRWLETHAYSAQQIFQRLREEGFEGGYSIVRVYVRKVRPRRLPAFLTLAFAPGQCAQVDWGGVWFGGRGFDAAQTFFFCHGRQWAQQGFLFVKTLHGWFMGFAVYADISDGIKPQFCPRT